MTTAASLTAHRVGSEQGSCEPSRRTDRMRRRGAITSCPATARSKSRGTSTGHATLRPDRSRHADRNLHVARGELPKTPQLEPKLELRGPGTTRPPNADRSPQPGAEPAPEEPTSRAKPGLYTTCPSGSNGRSQSNAAEPKRASHRPPKQAAARNTHQHSARNEPRADSRLHVPSP